MSRRLTVRAEDWPLREPFVISRMRQDEAAVLAVEIAEGTALGRGEADRSEEGGDRPLLAAEIERVRGEIEAGAGRARLAELLPPGPARSALDCALWDLEAKLSGRPAAEAAGVAPMQPVTTVFTIGLGTPEAMGAAARANAARPVLKLKLGRPEGDLERVRAVREGAPAARISVDANTGWTREQLVALLGPLRELGVELVEQPFPVGREAAMEGIERLIPVAADESCTDRASMARLAGRFDYVNIKLDKAGGLTEALALADAAEAAGMGIMVGCNLGTSLAMAPGMLLAQRAAFVDLDGPLLLARDREPGLGYEGSVIRPPEPALWG
ncbi:dipeptide epimerase [Paralimibaculum aggregatum]|uniref:Dipeptide epimerase n=1 Tax=Paralimibaculum aggregatum TaxID=3036245 RepID=A0ABQ6LHQ1_9RHOB|nr:N-acetyl-D-Glu racemase DgcA [Limibaculum sp. NKW23]GMG82817.1 dipeptide epimerase [Limibaculum sp. NKW23]